ncbi:MAG: hypothetical protein FWC98_01580 [Bacteroidales bacterium]|nr:hypothetical protein [Bacteroidales bacterium]
MKAILKITVLSAVIICGLTFISCSPIVNTPGRIEIVSRTIDHSLQDSAVIHGYLLSVLDERPFFFHRAEISIVETGFTTQDSDSGYFSIKILPGTYTIKVLDDRYLRIENAQYLRVSDVLPNEKIKVIFFRPETCF